MSTARTVTHGDCRELLAGVDDCSVDAVVTDPPYGLSEPPDVHGVLTGWLDPDDGGGVVGGGRGFMNQEWDAFVPGPAVWREVLRVLRPGGFAAVLAGARTVDLTGMALRLAGFRFRDSVPWVYASGMPKDGPVTAPGPLEGWATVLKPANEPILLVQRPYDGPAGESMRRWGVGALNVPGCAVAFASDADERESKEKNRHADYGTGAAANQVYGAAATARAEQGNYDAAGRWPPNFVLSHAPSCRPPGASGCAPGCPVAGFDAGEDGPLPASRFYPRLRWGPHDLPFAPISKAKPAERLTGVDPSRWPRGNPHKTIKPVELMRWLVRLLTPPGGLVTDPFAGSGTTGVAAALEGFGFAGFDLDSEYCDVARQRIAHAEQAVRFGTAGPWPAYAAAEQASRQRTGEAQTTLFGAAP